MSVHFRVAQVHEGEALEPLRCLLRRDLSERDRLQELFECRAVHGPILTSRSAAGQPPFEFGPPFCARYTRVRSGVRRVLMKLDPEVLSIVAVAAAGVALIALAFAVRSTSRLQRLRRAVRLMQSSTGEVTLDDAEDVVRSLADVSK